MTKEQELELQKLQAEAWKDISTPLSVVEMTTNPLVKETMLSLLFVK